MRFLPVFLPLIISAHGQRFIFPESNVNTRLEDAAEDKCKPLSQCPPLLELLNSNAQGLMEFDTCGFDKNTNSPKFICPSDLRPRTAATSECHCTKVTECAAFSVITRSKDFDELKKFERCGFDVGNPKYCCPSASTTVPPKKRILTMPTQGSPDTTRSVMINRILPPSKTFVTADDETECGISTPGLKIFGGTDALDHEFPWAVALVYSNPSDESSDMYLCGGTLVSSRHVLTAAHCINSKDEHHLAKVRLGHADLSHAFDVEIEGVFLHPEFERSPILTNDIAMLQLARDVPTTKEVRPICLGREEDEKDELVVAGWGLINHFNASEKLQRLDLSLTPQAGCEEIYGARVEGFAVEDSQICASGRPGTDSCKGDSGGPLMRLDDNSRFRLVGVTSFGTIKCDSSVPGVYSRVSQYKDWIQSIIGRE